MPLADPVPFPAMRSSVAASTGNLIFIYGGVGYRATDSILDVSGEPWMFDTTNFKWDLIQQNRIGPEKRRLPGLQVFDGSIYLFAGSGIECSASGVKKHNFLADFWRFSLNNQDWREVRLIAASNDDGLPNPRYFPVFSISNDQFILFGGYGELEGSGNYYSDTWLLRGNNLDEYVAIRHHESSANSGNPSGRYGAMFTQTENDLWMFGGFGAAGDLNDLWKFSSISESWIPIKNYRGSTPAARYAGILCSHKDSLLLFGGRSRKNAKKKFSDLWRFNTQELIWEELIPSQRINKLRKYSQPSYHAKFAHCISGNYLYMQGGEGSFGHVSDFWRLDLMRLSWELVSACRPDDPVFW